MGVMSDEHRYGMQDTSDRIETLEHSQEISEMLIYEAQKRIEELKQENKALKAELKATTSPSHPVNQYE